MNSVTPLSSHKPDGKSAPSHQEKNFHLTSDEVDVVEVYRRAKKMGYADITVTVQDGHRVKLWLTEKMK